MKQILLFIAAAVVLTVAMAQTPTETYEVVEEMTFSTHTINGADFPSAIATYKGSIYYGYIDPNLNGCIAKKDPEGNITTTIVRPGMTADDNHNEVSIAVDTEGYIHWTGDMHHDKMRYYRSASPEDISTFNELHDDVAGGGMWGPVAVSYGRFVQSRKGTLFYISRQRLSLTNEGWVPGIMGGHIQVYNTDTRSWSQLGSLDYAFLAGNGSTVTGGMDGSHQTKAVIWDNSGAGSPPSNAYQGYKIRVVFDKNNRMHMVWNVAKNPKRNTVSDTHTHLMYAYSDDEGVTWKRNDGAVTSLPLTTETGELVYWLDPEVDAKRMYNFCNIMVTAENKPVIFQNNQFTGNMMAFRFNGSVWEDVTTAWKPKWPGIGYTDDNGWIIILGPYGHSNRRSNDDGATWKEYYNFQQNSGSQSLDYQHFLETSEVRYQYQSGTTAKVITISWSGTDAGQVALPEITPLSGTDHEGSAEITINCPTPDATIRYSIGGSIPSETTGTIYTGPFEYTFTGNAIIKAIAYKDGHVSSRIATSQITVSNGDEDTDPPTVPENLVASEITATGFKLAWDASTDNAGVSSYDVYMDGAIWATVAETYVMVIGLDCETEYEMSVLARDAAGNASALSTGLMVETNECDNEPPTKPTGLSFSEVTETSFVLSWDASSDNVGVVSYDVLLDAQFAANTTETSIEITGLDCETAYTATVRAKDAQGNISEESDGLEVTTADCQDLPCTGGPVGWTNTPADTITGIFSFEFDMIAASNSLNGIVGLSNGESTWYDHMACIVRFSEFGTVDVRNGNTYASENEFPYQPNISYHIRMVVNMHNATYDVFIKEAEGTEVQIAADYGFRTEQASATQINNVCYQTASSCFVIDNMVFTPLDVSAGNLTNTTKQIHLFPNPATNNHFNIKLSGFSGDQLIGITIYDNTGRAVFSDQSTPDNTILVNAENFSSGIYLVSIQTGSSVYSKKLLIQKD
jgi:chitodextrinase